MAADKCLLDREGGTERRRGSGWWCTPDKVGLMKCFIFADLSVTNYCIKDIMKQSNRLCLKGHLCVVCVGCLEISVKECWLRRLFIRHAQVKTFLNHKHTVVEL